MIKFLLFVISIFGLSIQLDQPEFWNQAELDIVGTKLNFYYGWDKQNTFAYFRVKGNQKGWIALGFGDNLSKMDMIVLRLKSLRVEAEDRYSSNDMQIPELNTKLKDTFLIKGDRNANGDWDVIFKRKAISIDPRKVTLDKSQRYITVLLGEINDEEFTKIKLKHQTFKIDLSSEKLCHPSCKQGQCTGPSDQECSDCDYFRILFGNSCILRQPQVFSDIPITGGLIDNKDYKLSFGYSEKNEKNEYDYVYFKFQQIKGWGYWMGLMFNYSSTSYTDFYVVYQTSSKQSLVSDYFINFEDNKITEDEVIGDGDNDAFITDSSDYHITFARKANTGSKYDQPFLLANLNMTIALGTKDFFESETQPFQKQFKFDFSAIKIKCDPQCKDENSCYFDDGNKNCSECRTAGLWTTGSITECSNSSSDPNKTYLEDVQAPTKSTSYSSYLISDPQNLIKYEISSQHTQMHFEIDLKRKAQTSDSIKIPKFSWEVDYKAVSLKLNDFVIFLMCKDTKVIAIEYKLVNSKYEKQTQQRIAVYQSTSVCQNDFLKADIVFKTSYFSSSPAKATIALNLHVNNYDFKSYPLYSTTESISIQTPSPNASCDTYAAISPQLCNTCKNSLKPPYCCQTGKILSGCTTDNKAPYWNEIDLKSDKVKVSYGITVSNVIFFKYVIKTTKLQGTFGCGFSSNDVNTDMMIFSFKDPQDTYFDLTVKDYFSYGSVAPELDKQQNIVTISSKRTQITDQTSSETISLFEAIFARNLNTGDTIQDTIFTNSYKGPFICYLSETADLSASKREVYLNNQIEIKSNAQCHSSCTNCSCDASVAGQCEMKCTQCATNFIADTTSSVPKDQCISSTPVTCSQSTCKKCSNTSSTGCQECNDENFLYKGKCFPIKPEQFYLNDFKINFSDIGFALLYGFDKTKEHIYFNIQGTNQGYIALGLGKHSTQMDIIMIQNSETNFPIVTDMFSSGSIFSKADDSNDVAYVTGGLKNGNWNITVFRPILQTNNIQDMNISLVNNNLVSLALGQDQYISYHKTAKTIESSFQYVQAQGGQVNYTNTFIPEKPELYNKINLTKFNISLYYGFDKNAKFIYFKVVGKLHKNWFGIGFGNSMTSTDMIIIRYTKSDKTGLMTFVTEDKFSDGQKLPRSDISQDVVFIKSSDTSQLNDNTNSTVEFVRKMITNDKYSEDYDIIYKQDTKQTEPVDLIFAIGKDVEFSSQGHSLHHLMRDVVFKNIQDCSHCENQSCTGPDENQCADKTDTTVTAFSAIGIQLSLIFIAISLML